MKSRLLAASLSALWALPATAQEDRVILANGTTVDGVRVVSFDIRELRYTKGPSNESVSTDQVVKVELGKFKDVYRRGLRDPDMMLTVAREQLKDKNLLLAQLGMVGAAAQFFDSDGAPQAVSALDELQKAIPEAGVLPEVFRQKFEYYMGLGAKGAASAKKVAERYRFEATGGAWPQGLVVEAEFFEALAERVNGGSPADFQAKLRSVIGKASSSPVVANRANVQLAHSLREAKDFEGARRIYEDLANRDGIDSSTRAGAYIGLGMLLLDKAGGGDKDAAREALMMFLRVRLQTKDAWPSLQAEALYHAILAADKWRGSEYQTIMARCRGVLFSEFAGSEWAERAKAGR
ncbi:MAG: hypothetical protein JNM25_13925 [Planctomycetes bacterium]|nr:hypothetical protein [Planctomycetota bacterium]